jgi:dolichol-phosphate mannosyltransferase
LDHATGDAVVVMDADLQDPPELLPEMLGLLSGGYDVVSAQREIREGETAFKRVTARAFYFIFRKLVDERMKPQVGDFRMFSRRAIVAIRQLREQHRFMRGMVAWLGLKEVILPYRRQPRSAGTTKYSTWKMIRFAWTAISSFSALPLRLSILAGLFVTVCGIGVGIYSLFLAFVLKATVPGWTSLVCLNIIFSGSTLVAIGLLGEYVARIYEETKGRPLYVVSDTANFGNETHVANGVVLPPMSVPSTARGHEPSSRTS